MPNYRRSIIPGGTFFFTVVTFDRRPILISELSRLILRRVWKRAQKEHPFVVDAICVLPDHLHCIWTLPEGDAAYSMRWGAIKGLFTKEYLKSGGQSGVINESRKKRGEAAVWQRRFWEHTIRDDEDFANHVDYIYYNPVKHGLVPQVKEWPSYFKYVREGIYDVGWGNDQDNIDMDDVGGGYDFL